MDGALVEGYGGDYLQALPRGKRGQGAGEFLQVGADGNIHLARAVAQGDEGQAGVGFAHLAHQAPHPHPPADVQRGKVADVGLFRLGAKDGELLGGVHIEGHKVLPDAQVSSNTHGIADGGNLAGGPEFAGGIPVGSDAQFAGVVIYVKGQAFALGVIVRPAYHAPLDPHVSHVHHSTDLADLHPGYLRIGGGQPKSPQAGHGQHQGHDLEQTDGSPATQTGTAVGAGLIGAGETSATRAFAHRNSLFDAGFSCYFILTYSEGFVQSLF